MADFTNINGVYVKDAEGRQELETLSDYVGTLFSGYSTTEQKIGKWIDGSDLYQRTFVVTGLINNGWNYSVLGTSGIEIQSYDGYIDWNLQGSFNRRLAVDYNNAPNSDASFVHNLLYDLDIKCMRTTESGFTAEKAVITIKYTKTQAQSLSANMTPTVIEETTDTPDVEEDDMR